MIVTVDPSATRVELNEPDAFNGFKVAAEGGDAGLVVQALEAVGAGSGSGAADHVWVSVEWVRAQVGPDPGVEWSDGFGAMLRYAETKGWMNDDGTAIKAHVEGLRGDQE